MSCLVLCFETGNFGTFFLDWHSFRVLPSICEEKEQSRDKFLQCIAGICVRKDVLSKVKSYRTLYARHVLWLPPDRKLLSSTKKCEVLGESQFSAERHLLTPTVGAFFCSSVGAEYFLSFGKTKCNNGDPLTDF